MDTIVMGLTIHEEPRPDRLVTMGQADRVIERKEAEPLVIQEFNTADEVLDGYNEAAEKAMAAAVPIPDSPPEPVRPNKGRPKKMAKDQDLSKAGTKTIREDDPGEKGAIGSHGVNAPAQEKVPEKPAEGNKEGDKNG